MHQFHREPAVMLRARQLYEVGEQSQRRLRDDGHGRQVPSIQGVPTTIPAAERSQLHLPRQLQPFLSVQVRRSQGRHQ